MPSPYSYHSNERDFLILCENLDSFSFNIFYDGLVGNIYIIYNIYIIFIYACISILYLGMKISLVVMSEDR
jgi:hypothetical protein